MAIYHLHAKVISRSDGRSATAAAAYRAGENITDTRTGLTFDYTKKGGVDHTEIIAPDNAPVWASDRAALWNEVEKAEKRKDAQVCREVEIALPCELSNDQQLDLVRRFVHVQFVSRGMIADVAIHRAKDENPHAHILLTMRSIDANGFGQKVRAWNDKELLENWRAAWEAHANLALEKSGQSARIDHRTLAAQGIDREPQIHIGAKVAEMEGRGVRTEIGENALNVELRNERRDEVEASPEPGTNRSRDRADSPELGPVGGANRSSDEPDQHREPTACTDLGFSAAVSDRRAAQDRGGSQEASRRSGNGHTRSDGNSAGGAARSAAHGPSNLDGGDSLSPLRDSAIYRITALASPAASPTTAADHARRASSRSVPQPSDHSIPQKTMTDRSYLAARRQLDAMRVDRFEVGIRDKSGRMLIRTWSKAETLQAMPWLKRQNALGADVYVRPAGEANAGLLLVDDIDRGQLAEMRAAGMTPACVTETSPDNFQAWVRVSDMPLAPAVATQVAKSLAQRYGGDPNSADWRHFGRLAGFTNQKPKHKDANGRSPYVLAHESTGKTAHAGLELVRQAAQVVLEKQAGTERRMRVQAAQEASERSPSRDPAQAYKIGLKRLYARFGPDLDLSKADFMLATELARAGYKPAQIERALTEASPELPTRKAGHESDYVQRTVRAAMQHAAAQEQEPSSSKALEREIGPGMSL